jgi:hypothetical protein
MESSQQHDLSAYSMSDGLKYELDEAQVIKPDLSLASRRLEAAALDLLQLSILLFAGDWR